MIRIALEHKAPGTLQYRVSGNGTEAEVRAKIASALPEPKAGTREEWAAKFYDTGVQAGKSTVWAWFA